MTARGRSRLLGAWARPAPLGSVLRSRSDGPIGQNSPAQRDGAKGNPSSGMSNGEVRSKTLRAISADPSPFQGEAG